MCDNLHEAEKWRSSIIKEISFNVNEIQNASLGEHKIRDINDHINKLFREKYHWELRIKELGGIDYISKNKKHKGLENMSVGGYGGYLYFGAAKYLPGVKDLLSNNNNSNNANNEVKDRITNKPKRTRKEMYDMISIDYYGYNDDNSDEILEMERIQQLKARQSKINSYLKK